MEEQSSELFIVHVPQGRTARLMRSSLDFGIEGLHTNEFTTCNFIVCIGKDKIMLTHADMRTNPSHIKQHIDWVGDLSELIIIARDGETLLLNQLLKQFKAELPGKIFKIIQMDKEHDGIVVSFKTDSGNVIHRQIKKLPLSKNVKNLLHHPQEEKILAVQKIEQVIGLRASYLTKKCRDYQQLIFDGCIFELFDEDETSIRVTHKLTKEEMDTFTTDDTFFNIFTKVAKIIQSAQQYIPMHGDINNIATPVAFSLEGYLNKFDALLLFKRNINEVIISNRYRPISNEDRSLIKDVLNALNNNNCNYKQICDIFANYERISPMNNYKKEIIYIFEGMSSHYHDRMKYVRINTFYQEKLNAIGNASARGIKHYQAKEFAAASNVFFEVLKKASLFCLKNSDVLAKTYYNLGRSLQQEAKYKDALSSLTRVLTLRQNYHSSIPSEMEKIKKAMDECNFCIERQKNADLPSHSKPSVP